MTVLTSKGKQVELLAHHQKRNTILGHLMHGVSKRMIRTFTDLIWKKMKPVITHKLNDGWIHPEVEELYKDLTWLCSLDMKEQPEKVTKMFEQFRDIMCVLFDEDTFYHIRFWVLMHRIHDKRWTEAYDIAINRSNAFFNYKEIYAGLLERNKPLPQLEPESKEDENNGIQP